VTVQNIGEISVEKPYMHNKDYIFPLGYTSKRIYWSYMVPFTRTLYTCEVIEGSLNGHMTCGFRITAEDDEGGSIEGIDVEECFRVLRRRIEVANMSKTSNTPTSFEIASYKTNTSRNIVGNLVPFKERTCWDCYGSKGIYFFGVL
jgi:hypothetical protein